MSQFTSYEAAGVQVVLGDQFVDRLKKMASRPGHSQLPKGAGGYAAIYPFSTNQYLALTTDGVGTKVLLAHEFGQHHTIGIDLVAMCANDLICVGARPTAFLDYYATGHLSLEMGLELMKGIIAGCDEANMLLIGGETAEMPDIYEGQHYDLAGFAIGEVSPQQLLTGKAIEPGQTLIGLASSGIHSNGLSLARKVLTASTDRQALLTPTQLYVTPILSVLEAFPQAITGIAHITGGGWRNLFRLNPSVGFVCSQILPIPSVLQKIHAHGVPLQECFQTFNMGMGMALLVHTNEAEPIVNHLQKMGLFCQIVGKTTAETGTLHIEPYDLTLHPTT